MEETEETEVISCFTFYCWSVSFEWNALFMKSWTNKVLFFSCDSKIFIWRPPVKLFSYAYRKWVGRSTGEWSTGDERREEKRRNKERIKERLRLVHEQRGKNLLPLLLLPDGDDDDDIDDDDGDDSGDGDDDEAALLIIRRLNWNDYTLYILIWYITFIIHGSLPLFRHLLRPLHRCIFTDMNVSTK